MLHSVLPWTLSHGASLLHSKPSSTMQLLEQPSPLRVLPSSQASSRTMPSPQRDEQATVGPVHVGSRRHSGEQPSKPMWFPSSQLSAPSMLPSPQFVREQMLGDPMHLKPGSNWQRELQPSGLPIASASS